MPALAQSRFMDQAKEAAERRAEHKAVREAENPRTGEEAAAAPAERHRRPRNQRPRAGANRARGTGPAEPAPAPAPAQ